MNPVELGISCLPVVSALGTTGAGYLAGRWGRNLAAVPGQQNENRRFLWRIAPQLGMVLASAAVMICVGTAELISKGQNMESALLMAAGGVLGSFVGAGLEGLESLGGVNIIE